MIAELSGWDALWIALAGGAIATVLGYIARSLAIPGEVAANDAAVRQRDRDLESWLTDEHVRLKRKLHKLRGELSARGAFYSGEYGHRLNLAKEAAIHAYRDQERQARRDVALIHDRERWSHRLWRGVTFQPRSQLEIPAQAQELLDAWATPPRKHLSPGDEPQHLDDPRKRALDSLLDEIRAGVADFE